ncbi:MAG: hypothetical protein P0Y64_05690 [Candidatus Sphingomonas colombiensis]|nr:hypothetical protein [Sphingomonas sp.]WEK44300.1 MAG: hypothetical protein P0Y64_05690 [Sphingomonas sp.]
MTDSVSTTIMAILEEMDRTSDAQLGGPAAKAARRNARRVAEYLLALGSTPLPRHSGKASPGKVASALSESGERFNRQNFMTNEFCARLLASYERWESDVGGSHFAEAQKSAEAKEPENKRISDLERELLLVRAECQHLRDEVSFLRGFVAETGRLP